MQKYLLVIRGENFLVDFDNRAAKHGFMTNIYLEAGDAVEAETLAINSLREDEELTQMILNPNEDPPTLHCDEIYELDNDADLEQHGKTWWEYDQKRWWQFWKQS